MKKNFSVFIKSKRSITHFGYSLGFFSGFGTARIDEYDTEGALNYEYDGLVNLTGIAIIAALDKLTAGLMIGVDHLLDKNSSAWINNGKTRIGISSLIREPRSSRS